MELIPRGIEITIIGGGLVFLLLAGLWGLVAGLLRLERMRAGRAPLALAGAPAPEEPAAPGAAEVPGGAARLAPELVAAITAAVLAHRTFLRKQAAPAARSHQPGAHLHASRWVDSGRTRQNRSWPPGRG